MAQQPIFSDIKACVFDAYGTLFDVHSAIGRYRERCGEAADQISALWRSKQLEYTWLRSLMRRHADFRQITADALDFALDSHGIADPALRQDLLDAYLSLACYPEVTETLRKLTGNGIRCAILSNGSPAMVEALVGNNRLESLIEKTLSIEAVGIYKPDPRVYQLAVDWCGARPDQIAFQSANAWDAAGAASFGLTVAWINRFAQRRERLPADPQAEIKSLTELPGLLGFG